MCVYIYVCIYIHKYVIYYEKKRNQLVTRLLYLSCVHMYMYIKWTGKNVYIIYIYIYMYIHVCSTCMCIYICMYIYA